MATDDLLAQVPHAVQFIVDSGLGGTADLVEELAAEIRALRAQLAEDKATCDELAEQRDHWQHEWEHAVEQVDAARAVIRHLLAGDEPPNPRHHWRDTDTLMTPAEAAEIRAATTDPTPHPDTDECRISENGSVSHRWACQFGDDCPATDDPRVKAAQAKARPLPTAIEDQP